MRLQGPPWARGRREKYGDNRTIGTHEKRTLRLVRFVVSINTVHIITYRGVSLESPAHLVPLITARFP